MLSHLSSDRNLNLDQTDQTNLHMNQLMMDG